MMKLQDAGGEDMKEVNKLFKNGDRVIVREGWRGVVTNDEAMGTPVAILVRNDQGQILIVQIQDLKRESGGKEMKKVNKVVQVAWEKRKRFLAKANKLWTAANKPWTEGTKLREKSARFRIKIDRLRAEGDKLWAKGDQVQAEGNILFLNAVIEAYGDIEIEWNGDNCTLTTTRDGEITLV